jgi:hypothetical protein
MAARSRADVVSIQQQAVNPTTAALQEFQQRLNRYLELRRSLASNLGPLSPAAGAAELAAWQKSLATAIRTARRSAKRADLIPSAAATIMARTIAADLKRRASASVLSEVPHAPIPSINATYPAAAVLSTTPPLLLNSLPRLPDILQYRFYGRHLVILDADTQIILDYIPNVLPSH